MNRVAKPGSNESPVSSRKDNDLFLDAWRVFSPNNRGGTPDD
jgi:hypothetical protein